MSETQTQSAAIQHTLAIFERTCINLPPLLPPEIAHDMAAALEQMQGNFSLTLAELEDTMIAFGRRAWPYLQAFEELYNVYQGELGEKLFLQKAPPELRRALETFRQAGGSWREFYVGSGAAQVSTEQRVTLHQIMVDIQCDVRAFAYQAVMHTDRARYERRIAEFQNILADMERRLDGLRELADMEQEHPQLAAEIREQIRGFEYGLAYLGPQVDYATVCNTHDHFTGRQTELRRRGQRYEAQNSVEI